jgi:hypothetical protein
LSLGGPHSLCSDVLQFQRHGKRLFWLVNVNALLVDWVVLPDILARSGFLSFLLLLVLLGDLLWREDASGNDLDVFVGFVRGGWQVLDLSNKTSIRSDFTENDMLSI